MTYIKLLTVLAGLALLTACGGATPTADKAGGDNNTGGGGGNATNCTTNPFAADCSADATATTLRQTMCLASATADPSCGGILITYCVNNPTEDRCVVNTADWVAGFTPAPITTGDYTREVYYEFVQATAEGVDFGTIRYGGSLALPDLHTLDFTSLAGEEKNGVAWFEAQSGVNGFDLPRRFYSGIFSGTSLGAPLTSADASADVAWAGTIGWRYTSADGLSSQGNSGKDFDLTVDFANSEIRAFVNRSGADHFLLKATFDGTGRFEGTMNHATFAGGLEAGAQTKVTTGVITGIIGKQGAVGAFYGGADDTDDSQGNFAGGFVAVPPPPSVATHANFKTYYADSARVDGRTLYATPTATSRTVKFVEGTETSLVTTGLTFTGTNNFAPVTVRLKQASSGDDGFALMSGNLSGGNARRFGAGLLSGTDLGPALSGTSTANWTGSLHFARVVNTTPGIVTLPTVTVDFDNGTIKVNPVTVGTNRTVSIDGLFRAGSNNNGLPVGILGGKAVYTFTNDNEAYDLPLIGLIGTEGAIGVFHGESNDVGVTAIGGFQASPN